MNDNPVLVDVRCLMRGRLRRRDFYIGDCEGGYDKVGLG